MTHDDGKQSIVRSIAAFIGAAHSVTHRAETY